MSKSNVENARKRLASKSKPTEDEQRVLAHEVLLALSDWPTEKDEDYADRVLRARYYQGVTRRAQEYVRELNAEEYSGEEHLRERMTQELDGDQEVICTAQARMVGYVSDFAADAVEYLTEDLGMTEASDLTPERIAFVCLEHDVREALERELECSVSEWFERKGEES